MNRLSGLLLACAALAGAAAAREPEWRLAGEQEVRLSAFSYEPEIIRLEANRPVKLRLVNNGETMLVFQAKKFFRAAQVRSGDDSEIADGGVRIAPGAHRTIALVPAPGRYRLRSSNLVHRLLGMTGTIIVE